ncbi:MAG: DNA repair protein RecO [Planctomycetota bacterium]
MATDKTRALVLRAVDFSETSKIVTFYTEDLGKISALAKGGRRLKSKFEVALDLLSVCVICIIRKPSAELDLLTEATLEERFPGLTRDLHSLHSAYYVAEILDGLTQKGDPHPPLFHETIRVLRRLEQGEDRLLSLARYQLLLLRELGYAPNLEGCASCGGGVRLTASTTFSATAGGLLCADCARFQSGSQTIQGGTVRLLQRMLKDDEAAMDRLAVSTHARGELWRVVTTGIHGLLGRRPRTAAMLELP